MNAQINRRRFGLTLSSLLSAAAMTLCLGASLAHAADEAPDAYAKRMSSEVLDIIKADKAMQAGDMRKIQTLVDNKIMPSVDFVRMTASAVGPAWRQATDVQKTRLQEEFKTLLIHTYSGALSQISSDQVIALKPARYAPTDTEVLVRTEIKGKGEPIQMDYRMEKNTGATPWKIYNLNVAGLWLAETYRPQFSSEINSKGIDGLVASLTERNKTNANTSSAKK